MTELHGHENNEPEFKPGDILIRKDGTDGPMIVRLDGRLAAFSYGKVIMYSTTDGSRLMTIREKQAWCAANPDCAAGIMDLCAARIAKDA